MLEKYGHGGDLQTAAEKYGRPPGEFVDYSSNMNPFGPPEAAGHILRTRWQEAAAYPDPAARELTRRLAEKHGVDPACILVGNGAAELIDLAVRVLRPAVTGLARPSFKEYEDAVRKTGGAVKDIPLREEQGFELQLQDLEAAAPHCDLLFLGSPNNPTGRLLPQAVRERLASDALPAVVDEAFLDFLPEEEKLSLAAAASSSPNLIVLRSMTKFYAIPGLRLGYAVAHPDRIWAMRELQVPWSVNAFAQWIGAAVLEDRAYARRTLEWLPGARAELLAGLRELGVLAWDSDTNYVLCSLRALGWTGRGLQEAMGRRGILIRDASLFPGLDDSYVRLAVKLPQMNRRLLAVLAEVFAERQREGRGRAAAEAAAAGAAQTAPYAVEGLGAEAPASSGPDAPLSPAGAGPSRRRGSVVMLQGTASDVGKSLLTAALCRILLQDGRRVAPFKSQNMSLNSYVTPDGKEIGRAQGMQADACRIPATTDMNPILLKPKKDMVAQVVVHGRPYQDLDARTYRERYLPEAEGVVKEALERLRSVHDVVVIEGAGSPAEVNLKDRDIVNMRLAGWADAPVLLVADIDRGGVFASLVGTLEILTPEERARVRGFVINKFRGDVTLLQPGIDWLEARTGIPVLGVIPYLPQLGLEDEDSASLERKLAETARSGPPAKLPPEMLDIAVLRLPRISNFTDADPLAFEPDVRLRFVSSPEDFGQPDAVIIPGSKNTVDDLLYLRSSGLDRRLLAYAAGGGFVTGICAGYQMLGARLLDPQLVESDKPELEGLGLLPTETLFAAEKRTVQAAGVARLYGGYPVEGYEIHMGRTTFLEPVEHPFLLQEEGSAGLPDGAAVAEGRVWGTYLHGVLHSDDFRRAWLNRIRESRGLAPLPAELRFTERREAAFDRLAGHVRSHLDMERLYEMIQEQETAILT
ncbi:cobyric acid synthase [Paenibacillus mucilaginosus 3016]|uniref:Cobyric acid synthase n=1 Tax=Paenibacillus mucilaginosus 3016 TaxID=1116391 RepID=H6NGF8_9BACL|nr:cobyric acid synthase [Paenibacillus mucilaginosus 3016]WFA21478.1 cobyric acid synthase [Paenibacillus mucilaginosus]